MTTEHSDSTDSREDRLTKVESLVLQIIRHGGFDLKASVRKSYSSDGGEEIVVDFHGPDCDLLLEKNAALLDALEYVVLKAIRADEDQLGNIVFDCKGWRQVRAEELRLTASIAARQVIETGSPFSLNPMNPRERRIVHLALKEQPGVRTQSEGSGQLRKVVIFPAAPSSST